MFQDSFSKLLGVSCASLQICGSWPWQVCAEGQLIFCRTGRIFGLFFLIDHLVSFFLRRAICKWQFHRCMLHARYKERTHFACLLLMWKSLPFGLPLRFFGSGASWLWKLSLLISSQKASETAHNAPGGRYDMVWCWLMCMHVPTNLQSQLIWTLHLAHPRILAPNIRRKHKVYSWKHYGRPGPARCSPQLRWLPCFCSMCPHPPQSSAALTGIESYNPIWSNYFETSKWNQVTGTFGPKRAPISWKNERWRWCTADIPWLKSWVAP